MSPFSTHLCLLLVLVPLSYGSAQAEDANDASNAFSPGRGATALVVSTIDEAAQTVCVAAYSFTSEPIANALLTAKARGVVVRVTLDKSQSKGKKSILPYLQQAGLPVRINKRYAIMHDKFMVIDQKVLQLGSFNYTKNAETKNAENVLVIRRYRKVIASYAAECDRLWDEALTPEQFAAEAVAKKAKKTKKQPASHPQPQLKPDNAQPPAVSFP